MDGQHFYIEKTSDTGADLLLAVGFAKLLSRLLSDSGKASKGLTISDRGTCYELMLPEPISDEDLQHIRPMKLIDYLVTEKEAKKRPGLDGFDYEQQRAISANYFTRRRESRGKPEMNELMKDVLPPHPLLGHYATINQMKIAGTFNDLLARWQELGKAQNEYIHILLELFSSPHNDLEAAMATWQKLMKEHQLKGKVTMTALQIVNPTTGKGANRAKANALAEGNQESFWPLEYLKFVGFMAAANPYVVQGSKDRKTYVLLPTTLELTTLDRLMQRFRELSRPSTVVKMDILASLRLALAYVQLRLEALKGEAAEEDEFDYSPSLYSMVQGFEVGFYKDMGSAYATMNVSTINLPYWVPEIKKIDQGQEIEALLQEHIQIILFIRNSKREEGSEEYTLLRAYRDFLSGRTLQPFWQFTASYAGYLMSQREHEKNPKLHLRQLSVKGLDHLIMHSEKPALSTITRDEGFRRIAYAIRQATVRAQRRRSQEQDRTYEVRYGLAQELMREVRYREKFIAALSNFLTLYNAETAREEEKLANRLGRQLTLEDRRNHHLRGSVSISDIDRIVELIDRFDNNSELVGSLLVAYGYASEARREQEPAAGADDAEGTSEPDNTDDNGSTDEMDG